MNHIAPESVESSGSPRPFAHLHCHTHYSLLDGVNRIPDLVQHVKSLGMNALAITDHGNLYGAIEFYNACKAAGINPILGLEAYVAPGRRTDRSAGKQRDAASHLTLLAMNRRGFDNLIRLSSTGFLEGFHYKPRIDREILEECSDGLICLSGCASSELSRLLLAGHQDEARRLVEWYHRVFGDRFYLEIQNAGFEIQKQCLDLTVDLASRMGLPLVATNDAHYLKKEDARVQDIMLCVNTRTTRDDERRLKMEHDGLYICSPDEMYSWFPGLEDAVARSQEIADRVDIQFSERKLYPVFHPPDQKTDIQYLRELCERLMYERYGDELTDAHWKRLEYELSVIESKGYASYFLIVWDIVEFARRNNIPCGARGSACGAIVAYLLRLGDVCPIRYDLLFERFLDPSRTEPPDIDIDFCRDRRQMVIDYTKQKYGERNVAQIGTFGTLKAKNAIRDVGRVLNVPLGRVNELAKMVPETLNIRLRDALNESADLKAARDTDPVARELLDYAMAVEGLARSAGTHAAGVVIADVPLDSVLPLQTITGKEDIVTQWDGPTVEKVGLLKMDFLGLRNLTILDKAVQNVKRLHPDFSLDDVRNHLDDPATYALLQRGETRGVFQLESGGMRDLLTKMKPDCFADIIATSALYRPGPLEGGMVMEYVDVKHGRKPPRKVHPVVDEILAGTYGVMVYQEQVMRILNRVGNIELSKAYKCIKAISKKSEKIIAAFHSDYIAGAVSNGISREVAQELWNLIIAFAGYGFNKSHSTAYGLIAYETAYLKAHYPVEFMAALLSCEMESTERISEHIDDARRMKLTVLGPDINQSDVEFGIHRGCITFGLAAIKGVGENAVRSIVDERRARGPFRHIFDLTERVDPKILTKTILETLIKAGALDSLPGSRPQHLAVVERAVQSAVSRQKDKARGQKSLFDGDEDETVSAGSPAAASLPDVPDWTHSQKLAFEKEALGFYLTSHPLTQHARRIERFATHRTSELAGLDDGAQVIVGGMISSIKLATAKKTSRNGHTRYANFDLEDSSGIIRCIAWPEDYARYEDVIKAENVVIVAGKADRRSREPNLVVNRIYTLEQADREFTSQIAIKLEQGRHTQDDIRRVRSLIGQFPGSTDVVLIVDSTSPQRVPAAGSPEIGSEFPNRLRYLLTTGSNCRVNIGPDFLNALSDAIGPGNFDLKSSKPKRPGSPSVGR